MHWKKFRLCSHFRMTKKIPPKSDVDEDRLYLLFWLFAADSVLLL